MAEELTFESMKKILTVPNNYQTVVDEKDLELSKCFISAPFKELITKTQPKVSD